MDNMVLMNYSQAVAAALAGDNSGFEYLYNKTVTDKYYLAIKYMKNEEDASDVIQDAYLKAWKSLNSLNDPERFPAWIGVIVVNTAKQALKKKNPMLFSELENDDEEAIEFKIEDCSVEDNPEIIYTNQERVDILNQMMDSLSDEQRLCITMFYIEERSIKEIAEILECSENTVKSRLNYGRKNLAVKGEEMKKNGYRFFGFAPLPLLAYLIKNEAKLMGVNVIAAEKAIAGTAAVVATEGAVAISATATPSAGIVGTSAATAMPSAGMVGTPAVTTPGASVVGTPAATYATPSAGVAASTAATSASGTGMAAVGASIGTKIAITVAGLALVVGGGIGISKLLNRDKDDSNDDGTSITTEAVADDMTEINPEDPEATSEEEATTEEVVLDDDAKFEKYLEDVLVPELSMCDMATEIPVVQGQEFSAEDGEKATGILQWYIEDMDEDGEKEMIVFYSYVPSYDPNAGGPKVWSEDKNIGYIICKMEDGEVVETSRNAESEPLEVLYARTCRTYFGVALKKGNDGKKYILTYMTKYADEYMDYSRNTYLYSIANGELLPEAELRDGRLWAGMWYDSIVYENGEKKYYYESIAGGPSQAVETSEDYNMEYKEFFDLFAMKDVTFSVDLNKDYVIDNNMYDNAAFYLLGKRVQFADECGSDIIFEMEIRERKTEINGTEKRDLCYYVWRNKRNLTAEEQKIIQTRNSYFAYLISEDFNVCKDFNDSDIWMFEDRFLLIDMEKDGIPEIYSMKDMYALNENALVYRDTTGNIQCMEMVATIYIDTEKGVVYYPSPEGDAALHEETIADFTYGGTSPLNVIHEFTANGDYSLLQPGDSFDLNNATARDYFVDGVEYSTYEEAKSIFDAYYNEYNFINPNQEYYENPHTWDDFPLQYELFLENYFAE